MASKTNKYGNIVYSTTLPNGMVIDLALFESPFKDSYLSVSSDDKLIMGVSMEKKKDGSFTLKNVGTSFVKIDAQPASSKEESVPSSKRDL